jgi:hypothetical protein
MNRIGICVGVLAAVLAFVLVYRVRRLKPEMGGYASQRMCPACGLITPRSKAACLECGRMFVRAPMGKQREKE